MKKWITVLLAVVFPFICAIALAEGNYLYRIQEGDLYGYIDKAGNVIVEPQYLTASLFDDYGYAVVSDTANPRELPAISDTCHCWVIDSEGHEVVEASYIEHNKVSYHLFDYEREMEGLFSPTTQTVIYYDGMILDEPADDPASTRVLVSPDEKHYGYLDRITGEMVIPPLYDEVCIDWTQLSDPSGNVFIAYDFACFHEGYAIVGQGDRYWLIDEDGNEIPLPGEPVTNVHEGKLNIYNYDEGLWYVCSVEGQILSRGYDDIRQYHNGYCGAINWNDYGEFAIMDQNGKEVYRHEGFAGHEKFCSLEVENGYLEIVEGGQGEFTEIHSIQDGLLATLPGEAFAIDFDRELLVLPTGLYYNLCRMDGTFLLRLPFDACVTTWELQDDPFAVYYSDIIYEHCFFKEDYWLLCADNADGKRRYGYMNDDMTWGIAPRFIDARSFNHGLAWCMDEQGYPQYIDPASHAVWRGNAPVYDAESLRNILDRSGIWYDFNEDGSIWWTVISRDANVGYAAGNSPDEPGNMRLFEYNKQDNGIELNHKLKESFEPVQSVWTRSDEVEECLRLYANGKYERLQMVYGDKRWDWKIVIVDFGHIEDDHFVSDLPGQESTYMGEIREEDGKLYYSYPDTIAFELENHPSQGEDKWYFPITDDWGAFPPQFRGEFTLYPSGIWEYDNDEHETPATWQKDGTELILTGHDGEQYHMTVDEENNRLFYDCTFHKTYEPYWHETEEIEDEDDY